MNAWKSLGCLSVVALLAGPVYAGKACCGEVQATQVESRTEAHTVASPCRPGEPCGQTATISGNPCGAAACPTTTCKVKCKTCKIDADIEKLKVVNAKCSTAVCIEYQVDIECQPSDCFDLIVQIKCEDQIMYERIIPLENGEPGNEFGEFLYRGSLSDTLASVINDGRNSLRAEGNVVRRGSTLSLDRERERVRSHDRDHGLATPLYMFGEVLYTPVRWVSGR